MSRGLGWILGRLLGTLSCIFFGFSDWLYRTAKFAATDCFLRLLEEKILSC